MRLGDLTLEVRDRDLNRVGQVTARFLSLKATLRWCAVGEWSLTLPGNHPMIPHLSAAGSGVILYGPDPNGTGVVFSGPTITPQRKRDRQNPDGTYTFVGVTDDIHLQDALAYPSPAVADPGAQTKANDTRSGTTEALMLAYVAANIVPGTAPAGRIRGMRSKFEVAADLGRGIVIQKSPRFQPLIELLQEISTLEPTLGFRMVQVGGKIRFQVLAAQDRRKTVRFDVENGTVNSEEIQASGPSVTYAVVAGQGEGALRQIISRQNAASIAAETAWGRVQETFIDQRDTNDLLELQQSGDAALIEGAAATSVKLIPADDTTMQFGKDWNPGDWVTAVVDGQETWNAITEAVMIVDASAVMVGAAIGEVASFSEAGSLRASVGALDSRLAALERAALSGGIPPGTVIHTAATSIPSGYLRANGAVVARADYPALFAAIGTTYATGGETGAQFRIPSAGGRVLVGLASGQSEFDTLGETGGSRTVTLDRAQLPMSVVEYSSGSTFYASIQGGNVSQYRARAHASPAESQSAMPNLQPYLTLYAMIKF